MKNQPITPHPGNPHPGNRAESAERAHWGATQEVGRLIAAGKCKQAVELAKEEHKRQKSADSERLLVDAYLSRIGQFQQRGATQDAGVLLKLVHDRFPTHAGRLAALDVQATAAEGRIDELVAPLAREGTSPELRAGIETAIRRQLVDLRPLANCRSLPAEHPLKLAASAAWKAFEVVTTGPVCDDVLALPEISRHSPLAAWKLAVRAIAAFYRHDDNACTRAADAIPQDAAVRRLQPVLAALARGTPAGGPMAKALQARIGGDPRPLTEALKGIESALKWHDLRSLKNSIRAAIQSCANLFPDQCDRLRQLISVRCADERVPVGQVVAVMGPALRTAYFWRLMARSSESEGAGPLAAVFWERFLRHALAEGSIKSGHLEEAVVCLRIAECAATASPDLVAEARLDFNQQELLSRYYQSQPPEIAALAPQSDLEVISAALDADGMFRRAARIHPDPDTFRKWWIWSGLTDQPDRSKEAIAALWHEKRPADPQALLYLSELAEQRNALKLALKHLCTAEAIDGLNPRVRKARARLTLTTAWRHFKDRKAHLVEQDLTALESLPAMAEGDRPALLVALRSAWHALRGDAEAAQKTCNDLCNKIGLPAAAALMDSVALSARLTGIPAWPIVPSPALPHPLAIAEAQARMIALAEDMQLAARLPRAWNNMVDEVLRQAPCPLSQATILTLGNGAITSDNPQQAYLASAAGLAKASGPFAAWFLLMRARSLPAYAHRRTFQCLRAALDLARQANDPALMEEVSAAIDRDSVARRALASGSGRGLGAEVLADVLESERKARTYPRSSDQADKPVVAIENEDWLTGSDPFDSDDPAGEQDDRFATEDDDPDGPIDLPLGIPPEVVPILLQAFQRFGRLPTPGELKRLDPALAKRLDEVLSNVATAQFDFPDDSFDDFPLGGQRPHFPGRRGKKKRRR